MKFGGIQRLTLIDYPQEMACIVFTRGCNFRCGYCHNASLVVGEKGSDGNGLAQTIDEQEVLAFLEKRKNILSGVVVSGGEPLLSDGIEQFIERVKALGYLVKLDTNGTSPEKLKRLIEKDLIDYVAMDIKNSPQKYAQTVGVANLDLSSIDESIKIIMNSEKLKNYEFRTTVVGPYFEVSDFDEIGKWINGAKAYYLQSFRDSGDILINRNEKLSELTLGEYSHSAMQTFLSTVKTYVPNAKLRD